MEKEGGGVQGDMHGKGVEEEKRQVGEVEGGGGERLRVVQG